MKNENEELKMIESIQKRTFKEVEKQMSDVLGERVNINNVRSLSGGCIHHSSKVDTNCGSFFLKWNSDCNKDIFIREAESLRELNKAADGSVLVPKVFCAKELDETPAFLVIEYLEPGGSDQSERLGRGLAMVHKYQQEDFGFYSNNYCGATRQNNAWEKKWITFYRENRLSFLLRMIQDTRGLGRSSMKLFDALLDRLELLLPNEEKASLVHGDLWSGNYMLTKNGPALIDPAASYSHREMEFGIVTMFGGFSSRFFEAYNEVFPLEPNWRERNQLYQLYHVLNHYYLFGGGYLNQAEAIANRYL